MAKINNKKPSTSAHAVLTHSLVMLLKNTPMEYQQLRQIYNNSPMVFTLLHELLAEGVIAADQVSDGLMIARTFSLHLSP